MGYSDYLYTFVPSLCVGCADSTCECGGTENGSLPFYFFYFFFIRAPRREAGESTSPRGLKKNKLKVIMV